MVFFVWINISTIYEIATVKKRVITFVGVKASRIDFDVHNDPSIIVKYTDGNHILTSIDKQRSYKIAWFLGASVILMFLNGFLSRLIVPDKLLERGKQNNYT